MSKNSVKSRLIELYLNVKVRKSEEIENITQESIEREKERLFVIPTIDIINYIQNSIDVLVEIKACEKYSEKLELDEKRNKYLNVNDPDDENGMKLYEGLLSKAENDIRGHIRVEQELKLRIEDLEAELDDLKRQHGIKYYNLLNNPDRNGINNYCYNTTSSDTELLDKIVKKKKIFSDVEVVEINDLNEDNKTETNNDNVSNNNTYNNTYTNTINNNLKTQNTNSTYINVNTSLSNDKEYKSGNKTDKKKNQISNQKNRNSYKQLLKENDRLKALLATYELREKQSEIEEKKLRLKEMIKNDKSYYSYKKTYPSKKFTAQNNLHKKLETDYNLTENNIFKEKKKTKKAINDSTLNSQTIKSEKLKKEDSNYKSNKVIPVLKINELAEYNTENNEKKQLRKKESIRKVLQGNNSLANSSLSVNKSFGKKNLIRSKNKEEHKDNTHDYKASQDGVLSHKRIRTNPIISLSKRSTNRLRYKPNGLNNNNNNTEEVTSKEKSFHRESATYRFKSKQKNKDKIESSFNGSLNDKKIKEIIVTDRHYMKFHLNKNEKNENKLEKLEKIDKVEKVVKTEGNDDIFFKNKNKNIDKNDKNTYNETEEKEKKPMFYKINVNYKKDLSKDKAKDKEKEKEKIKDKEQNYNNYYTSNNTANTNNNSNTTNTTIKKERKYAKPSLKKHGKQNSVIINNYNSYNYFNLYSGLNKTDKKTHCKLRSFANKENTLKQNNHNTINTNTNNNMIQSVGGTINANSNNNHTSSFYKINLS